MKPVIRHLRLPVGEQSIAVAVDAVIYPHYRGAPTIAKVALGLRGIDEATFAALDKVKEELKKMPINRLTIPPGTIHLSWISLDDVKGFGVPYPLLDYVSLQFVVLLENDEGITEKEIEEIIAALARVGFSTQKPTKKN